MSLDRVRHPAARPGLTTAVHAMALTWPRPRRSLIAELDPDGAAFAARHAMSSDPGLVSFAAAGRRGLRRRRGARAIANN